MSYNPEHISPPDNPNAIFCDLCGEQIFLDDEDCHSILHGLFIHSDCEHEYIMGQQRRIDQLDKDKAMMVARGLS